jgi:hypothetical protein
VVLEIGVGGNGRGVKHGIRYIVYLPDNQQQIKNRKEGKRLKNTFDCLTTTQLQ